MQGSGVAFTSYGRETTAMAAKGAYDHCTGRGTCYDLRSMTGWWLRVAAR